jgi:hypothetical protein
VNTDSRISRKTRLRGAEGSRIPRLSTTRLLSCRANRTVLLFWTGHPKTPRNGEAGGNPLGDRLDAAPGLDVWGLPVVPRFCLGWSAMIIGNNKSSAPRTEDGEKLGVANHLAT